MSVIDPHQRAALQQATEWYTLLQCETAVTADQHAWQQWLQEAPVNQWAWQQIERFQQRLQCVPSALASRTLDLAGQSPSITRRGMLKGFALLAGSSALGWSGYQQRHTSPWLADYRSAVGERLPVKLADGGQLLLNTDSALDVQYDPRQRLVRLRQGEVMISTAQDVAQRPFYVQTPQGLIQALGTRFSVRLEDGRSEVAVYEHQVRITPAQGLASLLSAGQHSSFSNLTMLPGQPLDNSQGAWSNGLLIANDQRLDNFLAELGRYRHGWLHCDPAIAHLRISGTFALNDTDQALRALVSTLPVKVERRTRYWLTLTGR